MTRLILAAVVVGLLYWPTIGGAAEREPTREVMQQIFQALRVVLPLSVDEARFRDPGRNAEIEQSLRLLSQQTATLSDHAGGLDTGFEYLGRSLASYAAAAYREYQADSYDTAGVLIQRATDFCIACHSRLPSPADSPLAEGFVTQSQLADLPLAQRAELQIATRQFDAAIGSFEQLIADSSVHPADIAAGPLADYLLLCIRVKGDFARPVPVLQSFARRPRLWRLMREDIEHWIATLQKLRKRPKQAASLQQGRELMAVAAAPETFPMDRRPLVNYIVASSVLNRFIEALDATRSRAIEVAEAYFLLGLAEYRIGRDFWVMQADHYMETAIRLAPAEPVAKSAYAVLEDETIAGYSGSSGTHIPSDVQQYLDELRRLVDESR